jgi:hypothetical protein
LDATAERAIEHRDEDAPGFAVNRVAIVALGVRLAELDSDQPHIWAIAWFVDSSSMSLAERALTDMTIDKKGKWWVGTEPADTAEFLIAYQAEGYAIHETRICRCPCGSVAFLLEADPDGGCAQRTCSACGAKHLICDSAEYWNEADKKQWACTECGNQECNLGVGFSLYEEEEQRKDVRWISVGSRCTKCGTLGSFVDWKVGYGPSDQLLSQA